MSIASTFPNTAAPAGEHVLTVSQLTARLKGVVEESFPSVWVAGEISNFSQPQSGHCYFTLKDDGAQLRSVLWRNTATRLKLQLQDGLDVICRGRLDLYPPRGSYQLVVDELQPKGMGALELALRQRREKLAKEGLFDAALKRRLPAFPRRIGVVTSPTGAAIRDFLQVLKRRWRGVEVLVFPARVQGECATDEVVAGINAANRVQPAVDVLVITRGGGSLEDLWCFNEEAIVRAIAASHVPTVSAIGHEIDVTLADLAADVRALTPSEAAERVVPSTADVSEQVRGLAARLNTSMQTRTAQLRHRLDAIASRPTFSRPMEGIRLRERRADELSLRLHASARTLLRDRQASISTVAGKLETLSPLGVLGRGYSLTYQADDKKLITSARDVRKGQHIVTRVKQGSITSIVESIENTQEGAIRG
jgi:exodeoxyribonuclease VII large subunit